MCTQKFWNGTREGLSMKRYKITLGAPYEEVSIFEFLLEEEHNLIKWLSNQFEEFRAIPWLDIKEDETWRNE